MTRYASSTEVTSDRSRAEIERTLRRYGATDFAYGWNQLAAMVGFTLEGRQIRFVLPMPDRRDAEFTRTPTGRVRSAAQADTAYEQAVRQRWRALSLAVKAKLESVETGIESLESAFMAQLVLPDGRTVGEHVLPAYEQALTTGRVPDMLPSLPAGPSSA